MIAILRISGMVDVPPAVDEALFRLHLRRKYALTLIPSNPENLKLLQHIRNFVAYGDIDKETLKLLIEKRAQPIGTGKVDAEKIISELDKKIISQIKTLKPFFRLHPPRGGIDAKKHFGVTNKAVLGDNKKAINALIRRML